MVKKETLLKVFFVYLCFCHVAPGHPCGNNPLSRFRTLSRMLGKDINSLLSLLRESNPTLYEHVQQEWRLYADCVGQVDTGYFKRADNTLHQALVRPHTTAHDDGDSDEDQGLTDDEVLGHLLQGWGDFPSDSALDNDRL